MGQVARSYANIFSQISKIDSLSIAVLRSSTSGITLQSNKTKLYEFNPGLKLANVTILGKIKSMVSAFFKLRRVIREEQIDLIVTLNLEPNFLALLYKTLCGGKFKVATTEHTNLQSYYSNSNVFKYIFKSICQVLYKNADYVIGCSKSVTKALLESYSLPKQKSRTIYNSIRDDLDTVKKSSHLHERYICALGRLDEKKGFKELIIATSAYLKSNNMKLLIVGEGKERKNLEDTIQKLDLTENVELLGFLENPSEVVKNSWVFVSSSFLEGMPLNIIEAMSLSVPVVATDCKSGPREIIAPETNEELHLTTSYEIYDAGILIPTPDSFDEFERALIKTLELLKDQKKYKEKSEGAFQRSLFFHKNRITQEWIKFLGSE